MHAALRTIVTCTISSQSCTYLPAPCTQEVPCLTILPPSHETPRLLPPGATSTPRQVPHDTATALCSALCTWPSLRFCACSCGRRSDVNVQRRSSRDARLHTAVRPPPRRAQLDLPGQVLAGTLARHVRPACLSRAHVHPQAPSVRRSLGFVSGSCMAVRRASRSRSGRSHAGKRLAMLRK